jgi:hypothetical protein
VVQICRTSSFSKAIQLKEFAMTRKTLFAAIYLVLAATPCLCQEWAAKMFKTTEHDFGTCARGSKAEFDFRFTNLYRDDVHIANAYSSCGCTSVSIVQPSLKSWEEGSIHAVFNTPTFQGSRSATITVVIDKPMPAEVLLNVRGVIRGDIVFDPASIEFGDINQGSEIEKKVRVSHYGWGEWDITGITSSNSYLSGQILNSSRQDGWTSVDLSVKLAKNAPVGYVKDHITMETSEGQSVQMPLEVAGRIVSNVSVSPTSLFMGGVQPGKTATKPLVVKGNRPFKVLSVTCDDKSFAFGAGQETKAVHVIPVTFSAGPIVGKITKSIRITTDLGQSTADVSVYAEISSPTLANGK